MMKCGLRLFAGAIVAFSVFVTCNRPPLNPLDPNNPYTLGKDYVCRAESCGIGRVKLSWDRIAQPQIKGYRVYRSRPGESPVAIGDADTNLYFDSQLAAGQKYVYYYRILWEDGREIHKSPEDTVTTFDSPAGFTVKNVTRTRIELGWDSLNWLDNFRTCRVYRKQAGDFQLYDSTTANEYVDTSVQEGTTYHYTIAAVASDSGASNSTGEVYATPGNTPPRIDSVVPANPVALWGDSVAITCYAFDNDGDSITYTWDAPDGGTISGEGQSIVFTVPQDTQMTHRVKVIVSDAYGTGDIDSSVVSSLLGWVRVDTSGPRRSAPIAYDSRRDRVVFFGGVDGQGFYDDTWEWDGQHWVRVSTQGPSPRVAGLLVYDEARGDVLMFGGYNGEGDQYLGETWVWDGVAWTQKVVSEPSSRNLCASAYDSGRQRVVLFGGTSHWMVSNETWEWDGTQWSLRSTTGPCSRFAAVMAYDKGSGKCVLFGGITDWDGSLLHDTWVWDGSTWTQVDTAGPPARIQGAMAYNESRGKTVLFGGTYVVSPPRSWFDDTWEWDGQKWIQVSSAESPSGRATFMTYQENLHRIVLYGGYDDNEFFHDLWAYR